MAMEPKGAIASYEWDFKDNSPVKAGQSVEHTFIEPGTYTVTLTVRDAERQLQSRLGDGERQRRRYLLDRSCRVQQHGLAGDELRTGLLHDLPREGAAASGSALMFVLGGTELQNYNVLRNYAKTSSDTLLSKVIGGMNHSGGKPFVDANSAQYKALSELVPVMKQACTSGTGGINGPVAGQFWNGVSLRRATRRCWPRRRCCSPDATRPLPKRRP